MHQLTNETPYVAERGVQLDKEGNQFWVVVVKATYLVRGAGVLELAPEQEPVCLARVGAGEPGKSSLLREAELVAEHPGTDVTVNGTAHAPQGRPVASVDVRVEVAGRVAKALRVFGERVWERRLLGPRAGDPQPFVTLPLGYERAFGGADELNGKREYEPRNPIGRGFALIPDALVGRSL